MKQSNWISVKDRLPEDDDIVLVTDGRDYAFASFYIPCDPIEKYYPYWSCDRFKPWGNDITYWQPLPEPPEVVE